MGFEMMTMSIPRLLKLLYPTLLRLDEYLMQGPQAGLPTRQAELPSPLALSSENLDPRGAYLLFDGLRFVLWFGKVLPAEFVKDLLGPEAAFNADFAKCCVLAVIWNNLRSWTCCNCASGSSDSRRTGNVHACLSVVDP